MKKPDPKLAALWAKKLKRSGFVDIEAPGRDKLLKWDNFHFIEQYSPTEFEAKQRYFELAHHMLHEYRFATAKDKKVWELHCEGKTWMEIAKATKLHWRTVSDKLKKFSALIKSN